MIFRQYIKEKLPILFINLIIILFFICLFYLYDVNKFFVLLIFVIWCIPMITFMTYDFFRRRRYYTEILQTLEKLDKKYLISEIIEEPSFLDGKILYDIIRETDRDMHEEINKYKFLQHEYREYIETWVHEVKTPIASSNLIIQNNKNEITLSILEELKKVEGFIDQVLYYSRSNNVEKDYIIKELELKSAVNNVIIKNAKYCIQKKIKIDMKEIDETVFSDEKWVEFILNQIIQNAIKYSKKEDPYIKIYSKKNKQNVVLYIEDNGVGIDEKDLPKVFEKGFTGDNGRTEKKATGMGLYLCKKLCNKLGLTINMYSSKKNGTTVTIVFPKSKMMLFE